MQGDEVSPGVVQHGDDQPAQQAALPAPGRADHHEAARAAAPGVAVVLLPDHPLDGHDSVLLARAPAGGAGGVYALPGAEGHAAAAAVAAQVLVRPGLPVEDLEGCAVLQHVELLPADRVDDVDVPRLHDRPQPVGLLVELPQGEAAAGEV